MTLNRFLKSSLLFSPWVYLLCLGFNFYYGTNYQAAVDLNLGKTLRAEEKVAEVTRFLNDPMLFKASVEDFYARKNSDPKVSFEPELLKAEWNGYNLRLKYLNSDPVVVQSFIEIFANNFLKKIQMLIDNERLARRDSEIARLSRIEEQINLAEVEVLRLEQDIQLAEAEQLIQKYQERSKSIKPKHPEMRELLKQINANTNIKNLNSEGVLNYKFVHLPSLTKYQQEITAYDNQILQLNEDLSKLKSEFSNPVLVQLPLVNSYKLENRLQEKAWFKAISQTFLLNLLLQLLLSIKSWLTPTFRDKQSFNQQTNVSEDQLVSFPKLKAKSSTLDNLLPSFARDQNLLTAADPHQLIAVSKNVVDIKKHPSRQAEEQQVLENLAAELIIKSKSQEHKFFLFTSGSAGAGCTTVVANLAVAFSNLSEKVLMIDANFHNSGLSDFFGVDPREAGLTELMISGMSADNFIKRSCFEGLDILGLGFERESASKLVSTPIFPKLIQRLSADYNFILIDGGSILDSAQASLLATELGAAYLVINANQTPKDVAKKALGRLEKIKVKVDGVILNQAKS